MGSIFHSKANQSINSWASNFIICATPVTFVFAGAFGWLAGMNPQMFGHLNWGGRLLVGLAIALAALLALSLLALFVAVAFRKFYPPQAITPPTEQASAANEARLNGIWQKLGQIDALTLRLSADCERMRGLEARFEDAQERLSKVLEPLAGTPQQLEMIRVDGAAATKDIAELEATVKDHRERVLMSFRAVYARQEMPLIETQLANLYHDLTSRLLAGQPYDTAMWNGWESCHAAWRSKLDEWLGIAKWYALAVEERTNTVDDRKYETRLTIPDASFPDADAHRRFKKFGIIHTQWLEIIPEVRSGSFQVAFGGLSESEVRHGRPAG